MYFYDLIKKMSFNDKLDIYVDMDGVIAAYEIGKPLDFNKKRPLNININTLKRISSLANVELHILSICKKDFQIKEKNDWLDKYASFFIKENRHILSKETIIGKESSEMKSNFLKSVTPNGKLCLIDDDNVLLKFIAKENPEVLLFQDSELID